MSKEKTAWQQRRGRAVFNGGRGRGGGTRKKPERGLGLIGIIFFDIALREIILFKMGFLGAIKGRDGGYGLFFKGLTKGFTAAQKGTVARIGDEDDATSGQIRAGCVGADDHADGNMIAG